MKTLLRPSLLNRRAAALLAVICVYTVWQSYIGIRLRDHSVHNAYLILNGLASPYAYLIFLPFWFVFIGRFLETIRLPYILLRFPSACKWWQAVRRLLLFFSLVLTLCAKALTALALLAHRREIVLDRPFFKDFFADSLLMFLGLTVYAFLLFLGLFLEKASAVFALCFFMLAYDFGACQMSLSFRLIMPRMMLPEGAGPLFFFTNALVLTALLFAANGLVLFLMTRQDLLRKHEV